MTFVALATVTTIVAFVMLRVQREILLEIVVPELGAEQRVVIVRQFALCGGHERYDVELPDGAIMEGAFDTSLSVEEIREGATASYDGDVLTVSVNGKGRIEIAGYRVTNGKGEH